MKKNNWMRKVIYSGVGIAFFALVMAVLLHTAQNGVATTEILPTINPDPVYVVCESGEELQVELTAKEDFSISGFQLLLVNVSEESSGTLRIALTDSEANLMLMQTVPVETITPGKWVTVSGDAAFVRGQKYQLSLLADSSEPYFMQVPEGWGEDLPFEETVWQNGEALPVGISLGILQVEPTAVTYGDIFYYSVPASILLLVVFLLLIWVGKEKLLSFLHRLPVDTCIRKYGNDVFLVLLFAAICISIYSRAYLNAIYISADSTGYMREAVNLVQGNGFSYDGLAGYRSWFANWPVLYPAMIAFVMVVTKVNAYLASKLLTMVLVGLILIVLRVVFRKEAWIYALCLTNIGFLNLCYYTWSEIPFMLFLLCYGLVLARIVGEKESSLKSYLLLGAMGLGCFLTRYYGAYVFIVTGLYVLLFFVAFCRKKKKRYLMGALKLGITTLVSGILSVAYLLLNKMMNGMASGVSRTMWWDDYQTLTNDLIETLITEFFNVFSIQIPEFLENYPYSLKVFVVLLILVGVALIVIRYGRHFSRESVLITMAVSYEIIFIGIRYVSSMDTFYFRFFEPATFLLCIGILGLLIPQLREKKALRYLGGTVTVLVVLSVAALYENGALKTDNCYYEAMAEQWDQAYAELPTRSVVIFNDIDFRSSWYRPDIVEGTITPADTKESIKATYYGSDYLCIRAEFAQTMLESGEYEEQVSDWLRQGLEEVKEGNAYVVLPLTE